MKKSKVFRVELKDINIPYFYYGFGEFKCAKESNILISTLSRPNSFRQRMQIRNSWKKDIPSTMTHKFFVGTIEDERIMRDLKNESKKYGDMVFTSLIDSYFNFTLKVNSLYQFQQYYCPKVEYFIRADENTIFDVLRFQYWLHEELNTISKILNDMAIFGYSINTNSASKSHDNTQDDLHEAYNNSKYPEYIHGSSYLMSSIAVKSILEEAKNHFFANIDDVFYNGFIAESAGITIIDTKKHFEIANSSQKIIPECDENGRPFLFSVSYGFSDNETGLVEFDKALEELKSLKCSKKAPAAKVF
uniref:Hexosyltransferase n=1 Tax=Panagrolaimus sp. PS1159 TaxID=55785 RepID=A0AC35FCG2_9BILA